MARFLFTEGSAQRQSALQTGLDLLSAMLDKIHKR